MKLARTQSSPSKDKSKEFVEKMKLLLEIKELSEFELEVEQLKKCYRSEDFNL